MSGFEMYLIMKLDVLRDVFIRPGFFLIMVCCIVTFILCMEGFVQENKTALKWLKRMPLAYIATAVTIVIGMLIPSTKEMAVIIVAPKIVNSEFVQEDLPEEAKELYGLAKQYLKEQVEKESK
jgi:hypothetical protein